MSPAHTSESYGSDSSLLLSTGSYNSRWFGKEAVLIPVLVKYRQWYEPTALCSWHILSGNTNISDWNPSEETTPPQLFTWLGLPGVNGSLLNVWFFNMDFGNLCLLFSQLIYLHSRVVCTSAFSISNFAFVVTTGESLWKMLCYITLPLWLQRMAP